MIQDDSLTDLVELTNLPPVSRNLLAQKPLDPYMEVFYNSTLVARGWLDPNPQETDLIFKEMIESIISGREKVSNAVQRADSELRLLVE